MFLILRRSRSDRLEGRYFEFAARARNLNVYLYILLCADGSYYVGTTRSGLEKRIAEHQQGVIEGYTSRRRPVELVFSQGFQRVEDAIAAERQVKGWRREKK